MERIREAQKKLMYKTLIRVNDKNYDDINIDKK